MTYEDAYTLIKLWNVASPFTSGTIWIDNTPHIFYANEVAMVPGYKAGKFDLDKFWEMVVKHQAEFTLDSEGITIKTELLNQLIIIYNDPIQKEEWKNNDTK